MRIIIAPAKKMVVDTDSFAVDGLPQFLEQTEQLKATLQGMSPKELQSLWKCSDAIASLNIERLALMDLRRNLTPAVMAYEGIQYRYMAPGVMEASHLDYPREHLRILSGFYGLLRPFDGVTASRNVMREAAFAYLPSWRYARTSAALVSGLTLGMTFSIMPFSSMMNVERTTPMLTLP